MSRLLSRRQACFEYPTDGFDDLGCKRAFRRKTFRKCLGPKDVNSSDRERLPEEPPLRTDETEHSLDREGREAARRVPHDLDLLLDSWNEFRLVTPSDEQRCATSEQRLPTFHPTAVVLRIDHIDPAGCHSDVVDVRPRSRDAAVMQQMQLRPGQTIEDLGQTLFADRALPPGFRCLRVVAQRHHEAAQPSELLLDTLLTARAAARPFASRRGARYPGHEHPGRWLRRQGGRTFKATRGPGAAVPERFCSGVERRLAPDALCGIAEGDASFRHPPDSSGRLQGGGAIGEGASPTTHMPGASYRFWWRSGFSCSE